MKFSRLDIFMVKNDFVDTRNKAQELIKNSFVFVNNKLVLKPNYQVSEDDTISIKKEINYVSRAGKKIEHAAKVFNVNFKDKIVLDIGASTGGFTDFAIKNNAKLVYALDVGTDQLHHSLKTNKKVINLEKTHLNKIKNLQFNQTIDIILCDVSFISLKHVFDNIELIIHENTIMIFLIKPQFELNKAILDKTKGFIKSDKLHNEAIKNVIHYANNKNIELLEVIESPIKGSKLENKEFLGYFKKCK